MVATHLENGCVHSRTLKSLLLDYLVAASPGRIPGCDGMTTDHMLRDYPDLVAKGLVPGYQQLHRWHPDFQPQLDGFFGKSSGASFC